MPASEVDRRNASLARALAEVETRYTEAHPQSRARHLAAKASLPGGNTRTVLYYPPFPVTIRRGFGAHLEDIDGRVYVDFVCEYTAALYGHSEPAILDAIRAALEDGLSFGAPNRYEARLAELVIERFDAIERVRFCNSGTEANLMALSTARAVTGRPEILAFHGGYHGGILSFGHGGSPLNAPFLTVLGVYNDVDATRALIAERGERLAAVILEPVLGSGGCIPASPEFLVMLRDETRRVGALLIFDEVMTSRLSFGGFGDLSPVRPDLTTLGKYLGGGASFGAFGGRVEIMDRFDPSRPDGFGHAGTFNNNLLSMAAGVAGLERVLTREASARANALGDRLREGFEAALTARGVAGCVSGVGSMMNLHFVRGPVTRLADLETRDPLLFRLWQLEMLLAGYHVTPRGMLVTALPHTDADIEGCVTAFERFLDIHRGLLPDAG